VTTTDSIASQAAWFAERYDALAQNIESFLRGKSSVVRMSLVCMLAEGHLLIDDVPGVGKTSLAKAIANSIKGTMSRIQFTPDLLPTDVTGVQIYNASKHEFEFRPGPVFAHVVLSDEINRASPKTQSALLEVMEERQVTVEGRSYAVPRPFIVIATMNPVEFDGTYQLPEAQIDRFMMRMSIGYPGHESEMEVIANRLHGRAPEHLQAVVTAEDIRHMIEIANHVHVADSVMSYVVTITTATRGMQELRLGVSPRGSVALCAAAQAFAAANGRSFVTADDIKRLAPYVLGHRMLLTPEAELQGHTSASLLEQITASVPVPQDRMEQ
jgi:MoxR-like ATPase